MHKSSQAVPVSFLHISSLADESDHRVSMTLLRGQHQRSPAIPVGFFDISSLADESDHRVSTTLLRGQHQRSLSGVVVHVHPGTCGNKRLEHGPVTPFGGVH